MESKAYKIYEQIKNILLPPSCPICDGDSLSERTLCTECFNKIAFLPAYKCIKCGFVAEQLGQEAICGNCLMKPPAFDAFYGVVQYDEFSSSLITKLKFYDKLQLVPSMGRLMASVMPDVDESTIITGVPMYWRRRLGRRYNQSDALAKQIAQYKEIKFIPNLIYRTRYTKPQLGQSGNQRRKNLRKAFALNKKYENLKATHIILVDDVMTTGTTLQAVAKILKKKNHKVSVVVFARVDGHLY